MWRVSVYGIFKGSLLEYSFLISFSIFYLKSKAQKSEMPPKWDLVPTFHIHYQIATSAFPVSSLQPTDGVSKMPPTAAGPSMRRQGSL